MSFLFSAEVQFNWEQHTWWQDQGPLYLAMGLASFFAWRLLMNWAAPSPPQPQLRRDSTPEKAAVHPRPLTAPTLSFPDFNLATPDGKRENRQHLRREGAPVEVLISDAQARAEPKAGQVLNRSRGGLRLQVSEPAAVGATLCVRAVQAPEEVPWVRLRVKSCRQQGEHWELGGKFEAELPWSVLLLFG
jgi:hypothetical protein